MSSRRRKPSCGLAALVVQREDEPGQLRVGVVQQTVRREVDDAVAGQIGGRGGRPTRLEADRFEPVAGLRQRRDRFGLVTAEPQPSKARRRRCPRRIGATSAASGRSGRHRADAGPGRGRTLAAIQSRIVGREHRVGDDRDLPDAWPDLGGGRAAPRAPRPTATARLRVSRSAARRSPTGRPRDRAGRRTGRTAARRRRRSAAACLPADRRPGQAASGSARGRRRPVRASDDATRRRLAAASSPGRSSFLAVSRP